MGLHLWKLVAHSTVADLYNREISCREVATGEDMSCRNTTRCTSGDFKFKKYKLLKIVLWPILTS